MLRNVFVVVLVLGVTLCAKPVHATLLQLSDYSSDGSVYNAAEYLSADLDFTVVAATLTLIVTNNTFNNYPSTNQTAFNISELFFNIPTDGRVSNLALSEVWELNASGVKIDGEKKTKWDNYTAVTVDNKANGFGLFDVLVKGDTPSNVIAPRDTSGVYAVKFVFAISGTGPFSSDDFTTYMSAPFDNNRLGLAAGKFVSGGPSGNESAYGVVVPEPATIALLGLGGLTLLGIRKKKR